MKHVKHIVSIPRFAVIAICALLSVSAYANDESAVAGHKDHASANSSMTLNQSMDHMKQDMGSMHMTGDADRDFATMMRMHHQHGIDMAEAELAQGKDESLKAMARKLIASQKKEVAEFDQWLSKHKTNDDHHAPSAK